MVSGLTNFVSRRPRAVGIFEDPEPADDPVDGAAVLDEIAGVITSHLALRAHDDTKAALWTLHTLSL
jgi:hypothetical protein